MLSAKCYPIDMSIENFVLVVYECHILLRCMLCCHTFVVGGSEVRKYCFANMIEESFILTGCNCHLTIGHVVWHRSILLMGAL